MSVRSRLEAEARRNSNDPVQAAVDADAGRTAGTVQVVYPPVPEADQDPSMPGVPTVAAPTASLAPVEVPVVPVVAPIVPVGEVSVPTVALAPVEPELRYEYQPTDDAGKPMGGKQVVVYRTPDELAEKLANNSVLLLRQLRKERREKALGVTEDRIDDAEKFQNVVEFKPRELTADERFHLAQDISNPETFADARDRLLESAFGVKPSVLATTLNDMQRREIQARAVENYLEFVQTAGFADTMENRALVTGWLGTRNLAPTVANFTLAQSRLKEAGLLQEAPVVQLEPVVPAPAKAVVAPVEQEPKPQVPTTPPPALVAPESQEKRHSHVPSGLTASIASPAGPNTPVGGFSMTLAEVDKMSSDEYKKRLRDPQFAAYVNKLEADAAARRRARANGQPQ
jgi:hypothetical protein